MGFYSRGITVIMHKSLSLLLVIISIAFIIVSSVPMSILPFREASAKAYGAVLEGGKNISALLSARIVFHLSGYSIVIFNLPLFSQVKKNF